MILLMDNGSLEPAATLALRQMAEKLGGRLGQDVTPVSLLHSSAIPADQLEGQPAEILEPALERRLRTGIHEFLIIPAFFGPSGALTDYLPRRVSALKNKFPDLRVRLASPLVNGLDVHDDRLAKILAQRVRFAAAGNVPERLDYLSSKPAVILVDHGSPAREVTAVRNHVAAQLQARLGDFPSQLIAASMERRPGPEYAFSDPLLEHILRQRGFDAGLVIVALLFLSPGRHAGPGGDIEKICADAAQRHPRLQTVLTAPLGNDPLVIEILAERALAARATPPL